MVDPGDGYALIQAVQAGDEDLVQKLLENSSDRVGLANFKLDDGNTALHFAAELGNAEIVGDLLRAGAYMNPLNGAGSTPTDKAMAFGNEEAFAALVNRGGVYNLEAAQTKLAAGVYDGTPIIAQQIKDDVVLFAPSQQQAPSMSDPVPVSESTPPMPGQGM